MHLSEAVHIRYLHSISELEKSQKRNFQLHDLLTLIGLAQATPPQAPPPLPLRILSPSAGLAFSFDQSFKTQPALLIHLIPISSGPASTQTANMIIYKVSFLSPPGAPSLPLSLSRSDHVRPRVATLGLVCLFVCRSAAEPRNLRISSPETSSFPTRTLSSWSMTLSTRLTVL